MNALQLGLSTLIISVVKHLLEHLIIQSLYVYPLLAHYLLSNPEVSRFQLQD